MKKFLKIAVIVVVMLVLLHVWCSRRMDKEDWILRSDRIPAAFDGYRITLITDLHGAVFGKDSQKLLSAVKSSDPDLIAISGDLIDKISNPDMLEPLLPELVAIAPTCYVTGNHEWTRDDLEDVLKKIEGYGVTVLRNQWQQITIDGQSIVLAGTEDPNGYADQMQPEDLVAQIRETVPGDPYIVMLYHRNDAINRWAELDVDLVLSGHGHGGVVRLPLIGGLIDVDRSLFPKYCDGLYQKDRTAMAVSRGLSGLRFWNSPHLPTIVLESVNIS